MSDQKREPREWWLNQYENEVHPVGSHFYGGKTGREEQPYIHVIEKSAYDELLKERDAAIAERDRLIRESIRRNI